MTRIALAFLLLVALAGLSWGQFGSKDEEPRLPNGKSQRLAILKENHRKTLADVAEIRQISRELEDELEANTEYIVSLDALSKAERIEELARDVGKRMKQVK